MHTNTYKHPSRGIGGRLVEALANSSLLAGLRRSVTKRLPFVTLESDVTDVVYLTWLVDAAVAQAYAPPGTQLWQRHGLTPFTTLTYLHGNFGPSFLGPLRSLCGSPAQSNWRFYVDARSSGIPRDRTVLFTHNVLDSLPYVLGARLLSDALPAHLSRLTHKRDGSNYRTEILPAGGSAPRLASSVRLSSAKSLSPSFERVFGSWSQAVEFLTLQEAAIVAVDRTDLVAHAEIDLPVDLQQVFSAEPMEAPIRCPFVNALGVTEVPLCFVVPRVKFRVLSEGSR